MKRFTSLMVLSLATAMAMMAQAPPASKAQPAPVGTVIKCKGVEGKPCTSSQIQFLTDAVFAQKNHHDALAAFESLSLASSDGTLKCVQTDKKACTNPQLDLVKQIGADHKLYINYSASKANTRK
jgi:hypothetical protein